MEAVEPARVLVTGATGFIGREVTRRLLASGRAVTALARGADDRAATARVAEAVGASPDGRQVEAVTGDLTQPGCGLEPRAWRRLRETTTVAVHCAGDTSFVAEATPVFRAGHVDGPVALLRGLAGGRIRRWIHLSTAYVCGCRSGLVREGEGDVGQTFHNAYERVKLESERAIRVAAHEVGVEVSLLRPSVVVGAAPATAGGTPANLFFAFIRLVAMIARLSGGAPVSLRIAAAPRAPFNIVPLDYVAAAVVALAEHPDAAGATAHLVVSEAPTQETMLAMIVGHLGARGLRLVDARGGLLDAPTALERRVARLLTGYRAYLTQDVRFDDAVAQRLLAGSGVACPTVSTDAVRRWIDQALMGAGTDGLSEISDERA